jgi:hypothetical protein
MFAMGAQFRSPLVERSGRARRRLYHASLDPRSAFKVRVVISTRMKAMMVIAVRL